MILHSTPPEEQNRTEDPEYRLTEDSSPSKTSEWLRRNGFEQFQEMFVRYTGADMMRLSKVDVREICGIADGNRLYNALHRPSFGLRLYVQMKEERFFRALFLERLAYHHFTEKIASLLLCSPESIEKVTIEHTSGIPILITDDVIRNMTDESLYSLEVVKDTAEETTATEDLRDARDEDEGATRHPEWERSSLAEGRERSKILVKLKIHRNTQRH